MEQPTVSQASDNLFKRQWGRGFFYKQDGQKRTLVPKKLYGAVTILFILVTVLFFFQGGQETGLISRASPISAALNTINSATEFINFPKLSEQRDGSSSTAKQGKKAQTFSGPQVIARSKALQIPPGLMSQAVLISGASNNLVRAELTESLTFNNELLVEAGTILVGHGSSTEERLFINFSKMVLKDGRVEHVQAKACDLSDKIVGLKGSKIGKHALQMAGSVGLGFIGGLSEGLQDSRVENGAVVREPSLKNALLHGTATAALEQSRELMTGIKDKAPIIEVKEGTPICVLFDSSQ